MYPPGLGPFGAAEVYYLSTLIWINAQITIGNARDARLTSTDSSRWPRRMA